MLRSSTNLGTLEAGADTIIKEILCLLLNKYDITCFRGWRGVSRNMIE